MSASRRAAPSGRPAPERSANPQAPVCRSASALAVEVKSSANKFRANSELCNLIVAQLSKMHACASAWPWSGREPWERAGGRRALCGVSWAAAHVRRSPWPAVTMCWADVRPLVNHWAIARTHARAARSIDGLLGRRSVCARSRSGQTRRLGRGTLASRRSRTGCVHKPWLPALGFDGGAYGASRRRVV